MQQIDTDVALKIILLYQFVDSFGSEIRIKINEPIYFNKAIEHFTLSNNSFPNNKIFNTLIDK